MKSLSSKEIIRALKAAGWYEAGSRGDHFYFKHSEAEGKVTVVHPLKDTPIGTVKAIEKQTGVKLH